MPFWAARLRRNEKTVRRKCTAGSKPIHFQVRFRYRNRPTRRKLFDLILSILVVIVGVTQKSHQRVQWPAQRGRQQQTSCPEMIPECPIRSQQQKSLKDLSSECGNHICHNLYSKKSSTTQHQVQATELTI